MSELFKASVIIVAAGKGSRMKTDVNKQYLMLSNKPILAHTIEAFEKSESVSEIIVVIHNEDRKLFEECILERYSYSKISVIVNGGEDRQASVYNGLMEVSDGSGIVLVHDGVRPMVTPDIIEESIKIAIEKGVSCVGVPVKDTIKTVNKNQVVEKTLDRSSLWMIQTPQVFKKDILVRAHEYAVSEGFRGTDDSVLTERLGYSVQMVMGSYINIKITTPEDLVFAEAIKGTPAPS